MAQNFDRVLNQMYPVIPRRRLIFREATGYDEANDVPIYAPDREIQANILDKPEYVDEQRGALVVMDGVRLSIWFRDWFVRVNDVATDADLVALEQSLKGTVREVDGLNHSRFYVDGKWLQYQSHAFSMRPDGKLYAVRITLQAA